MILFAKQLICNEILTTFYFHETILKSNFFRIYVAYANRIQLMRKSIHLFFNFAYSRDYMGIYE